MDGTGGYRLTGCSHVLNKNSYALHHLCPIDGDLAVPGEMGRLAQNHTHGIRPHIDAHLDDTLLVGPLLFHATVLFVEIRAAHLDCNAAGKLSGVITRDVDSGKN